MKSTVQAIRVVSLRANRPAEHAAEGGHPPVVDHFLRGGVEVACDHFAGDAHLRAERRTPAHALERLGAGLLIPDMLLSTKKYCGLTGHAAAMWSHTACVAIVTMFCPEASPVVKSNIR
ncbi:MAG: hypothetical protein U1F61_09660 [Opitutaceae bacterium]